MKSLCAAFLLVLILGCSAQPAPTGLPASAVSPSASSPLLPTYAPTPAIRPSPASVTAVGPSLSPAASAQPPMGEVRLMAVGDVMLARTIGSRIEAYGSGWPFADVTALLATADITVANLECAISDRGTAQPGKDYTFRAPIASADALASAPIDLVTLANNHALDFGPVALHQTISLLDERGIGHVGAGSDLALAHRALIVERKGLRVTFLGYVAPFSERSGFDTAEWEAAPDAPGVAIGRADDIAADVRAARSIADVVVVFIHAGLEQRDRPTLIQRSLAAAAIGAGAALVIAAHPHVLQGYSRGDGTLIAFSLGNFVFDGFATIPAALESAILDVTLGRDGVAEVRWLPVIIEDGRPRLAEGDEQQRVLERLAPLG